MYMQIEKFSNYGYPFQTKLIACLLSDTAFTGQVYDLIELDYFESESIQWLIEKLFVYFREYKRPPTLDYYKVHIVKVEDELKRKELISTLREATKQAQASDLDFVKTTTIDFCKNQKLKNAILESVPLLKSGQYDAIKTKIDTALKIGNNTDIGLDYLTDIESRYMEEARSTIETGWDVIDEITKGGLGAGELGLIIAGSGAGKSWCLTAIGANAMRKGKTVIHYTLELGESYLGIRYDCVLSGVSLDKIKNHVDHVKKQLADIEGKLIIKWYPTKSISLMGIRAHLTKVKMQGIDPDIIIIDYADLLKYENKNLAKHEILEYLFEEIRGLGGEYKVPVWTVSQSNREGFNDDIIEADKTAGSYGKIFTPDFIMSLSRKQQDKISNTARAHIIKNRFGVDGITFPVLMDTSKGIIKIYEDTSTKGKELSDQMQSDKVYEKKLISKRFKEIGGRPPAEKKTIF